ncbi:hypothetical protein MBRA1_002144 [Malassezia brasiliensis]|uniref:Uncharacterized protein n=1 Tax=Malassezia brasiliensis TaxID=1821822 RepID=A0AAF0DTM3_9BASI|nr:hypothetical protein MBRA1_002144 [Malassezia brasiliensis]
MAQVNPVLALVSRADSLANGFNNVYQQTLPAVDALAPLHPDDPQCEPLLQVLRDGLTAMEGHTEQMVNMLYEVDVYLAPSATQSAAGFNPQEALSHVSDLFHSYQAELLAKREALADYTCEDITPQQFAAQWRTLDEVQAGRKQEMDDLADLLAQFG